MRYSTSFIFTTKETGKADTIGHEFILRSGLAQQVTAGHYSFLPLGMRILRKLQDIIREEMERAGALEISMPIMQPASLWQESGRWEIYGEEMYKLKNRTQRDFCLGPTHEELIVDLARQRVNSYKQLPFTLFQFGTKFRDELRPKGGLLRAKEFLMKDAYSFDATDQGVEESYRKMREAYIAIFRRTGIHAIPIGAGTGEMGGSFSEEFIAPSRAGEDRFVIGSQGDARKLEDVKEPIPPEQVQVGIEIGHIFKLGNRYSKGMNLHCMSAEGQQQPVIMGCYGIGVSRMLPTIIEQHHDAKGIIWPREVAPFEISLIPTRYEAPAVREHTDRIYRQLVNRGIQVLLDDRDASAGAKFADADLLGIPFKLIVGPKSLEQNTVECEPRTGGQRYILRLERVVEEFEKVQEAK